MVLDDDSEIFWVPERLICQAAWAEDDKGFCFWDGCPHEDRRMTYTFKATGDLTAVNCPRVVGICGIKRVTTSSKAQ